VLQLYTVVIVVIMLYGTPSTRNVYTYSISLSGW